MENLDLVKQYIQSLNQSLDILSPQINNLTAQSFEDRFNSEPDALKRAKIANNYAYILTTLCFAYLKSIGVDTAKHPIMAELDRVKSYMKRYKDAESGIDGEEKKKDDTEQAKRFINAALGNSQQSNLNTVREGMSKPAISTHTKFEDVKKDDDEVKEIKKKDAKVGAKKLDSGKIRNDFKSDNKLQRVSKSGNATGKNLKRGKFAPKALNNKK